MKSFSPSPASKSPASASYWQNLTETQLGTTICEVWLAEYHSSATEPKGDLGAEG